MEPGCALILRHHRGLSHYGHGVSVVEQGSRSGVIWSGAITARARPSSQVPGRAFLAISGSHSKTLQLPDGPILQSWVDTLSRWGYSSVRTCPVAPLAATALSAVGFFAIQTLTLLERNDESPPVLESLLPHVSVRFPFSRVPGQSMVKEILRLDRAAFGEEWTMDTNTFHESLRATRRTRIFVSAIDGELSGFVMAGVADSYGLIQRLAVHPKFHRKGNATQLVQTALSWIHSRGCRSTVVNTETSNVAAMSLYEKCGFDPLDYGLAVMERQLD